MTASSKRNAAGRLRLRAFAQAVRFPSVRRRVRWRNPAVGLAVAVAVLVGGLAGAVPVPPRQAETADAALADARRDYAAALALRDDARARLDAAQARAIELEGALRAMSGRRLALVTAYEESLARARALAVAAYVHGGRNADLVTYLEAERATQAAVRLHLSVGRVDHASEAAEELRAAREEADEDVRSAGDALAAAVAELEDSEAALRVAEAALVAAYERLVAAEAEAEAARARAEAEAAAEEARQAAAAAAAAAAEAATVGPRPTPYATPAPAPSPPPAPAPTTTSPPPPLYRDGADDGWARLRECESGGNYRALSPGGLYRGAYQFDQPTWESVGGTGDPAAASPAEQDYRARLLYEARGNRPWPVCGRYLP